MVCLDSALACSCRHLTRPPQHIRVASCSKKGDGSFHEDPFDNNVRPVPVTSGTAKPSPPTEPPAAILQRRDADQRASFLALWTQLSAHMREIQFHLHGDDWTPEVIEDFADILHNFIDVFSTSLTGLGECTLRLFKLTVPPGSARVR